MAADALAVADLTCEHLDDPLGIDTRSPRLSWTLRCSRRGARQAAYQILVSHDPAALAANEGTLWDTGRVESDETIGIAYGGAELRSGMRCWWKVRVWDEEGRASSFSAPAWWEMAILDPEAWVARWIGLDDVVPNYDTPPSDDEPFDRNLQMKPSPHLRRTFELDRPVRRARAYVSAKGLYELYLNGTRVGDHVLAPGWTDYDERIQYQTYDVTGLLRRGANAIGAVLGDGWYCGYVGFDQKRRGAHYGTDPQLFLQLEITHQDGSRTRIVSDESWRSTTGPLLHADLLMGEWYDARRELGAWTEPGFADDDWLPVSLHPSTGARVVAQPDRPARVTADVAPNAVTQPRPGVHVFDLGQNMVGWVRLRTRGPAGTKVVLRYGEMLRPDGTLYTDNWRTARQVDTYVLRGGGWESYEPRFTFHGFRYVEVTGLPSPPELDALTGRVVRSDLPETIAFACSSTLVNQLHRNILWTQRGNFLSVPTDCPQRDERLGWLGDAQVFARTACFNMDVVAFFEKWLDDVVDAQSEDGAFPDVAPRVTVLSDGAPAWGDAGVIVPWTLYRHYGDRRVVERHYEAMDRWVAHVQRANPDLVRRNGLGRNYGDWLAVDPGTPKDLIATAYFAHMARLMAEMARAIGRHTDAARYRDLYESVREAFIRVFVHPDGRVEGGTQTAYVLALHMDLLPHELRKAAAAHLVEDIEHRKGHLSTGFLGVGLLCPVLSEAGYDAIAYRLLLNDTYPSWGYSIEQGATTIWERWDGWTEEGGFQTPSMNSFNQYALGSVGEWLYRYVGGVDSDASAPGFKRVRIQPRPHAALSHAEVQYESIRGPIRSAWRLEGDVLELQVAIPPNTDGVVTLPIDAHHEVTEGGQQLEAASGVEVVHRDRSCLTLRVASGEYHFVAAPLAAPVVP